MKRPVHPSFGQVTANLHGYKCGWTGTKIRSKSSKTIDIVSYALNMSVNGVKCVSVAHFRSSGTF